MLVATPEKLNLTIRSDKISRPLALLVLDEAHNLEDADRGIRIELTLATVKRDHPTARFLLLTPFVPNGDQVAKWLAPESGRSISLSTSAWRPNERMVGALSATAPPSGRGRHWGLEFATLLTSSATMNLDNTYRVGDGPAFDRTFSQTRENLSMIAAAGAKELSGRGTAIVVSPTVDACWRVAREIANEFDDDFDVDSRVALVRRYLEFEFGPDFELVRLLKCGVGVHHAAMSDETRSLMEWLAETGKLRVLCATSTISQGINFPVSSIFLASRNILQRNFSRPMTSREFWNLAGRAGRVDQQSIGVVAISSKGDKDKASIAAFLAESAGDLASRLVQILEEVQARGQLHNLEQIIYGDQWADFRSYIAHMVRQQSSLASLATEAELLLRNTFGYSHLETPEGEPLRRALLNATTRYAHELADKPGRAAMADSTGFSPETVGAAIGGMINLDQRLTAADWQPTSIFGSAGRLPELVGVLMRMPQIRSQIEDLAQGGSERATSIAALTQDWVSGKAIADIAAKHFARDGDVTESVSAACRAIYRNLTMAATWGISALTQLPGSGIDFDTLSEEDRRQIGLLGAMVYHGVSTEEAIAMRMNAVPRSVAQSIGEEFAAVLKDGDRPTARTARLHLEAMSEERWDSHKPVGATVSGDDLRSIWQVLNGSLGVS